MENTTLVSSYLTREDESVATMQQKYSSPKFKSLVLVLLTQMQQLTNKQKTSDEIYYHALASRKIKCIISVLKNIYNFNKHVNKRIQHVAKNN